MNKAITSLQEPKSLFAISWTINPRIRGDQDQGTMIKDLLLVAITEIREPKDIHHWRKELLKLPSHAN